MRFLAPEPDDPAGDDAPWTAGRRRSARPAPWRWRCARRRAASPRRRRRHRAGTPWSAARSPPSPGTRARAHRSRTITRRPVSGAWDVPAPRSHGSGAYGAAGSGVAGPIRRSGPPIRRGPIRRVDPNPSVRCRAPIHGSDPRGPTTCGVRPGRVRAGRDRPGRGPMRTSRVPRSPRQASTAGTSAADVRPTEPRRAPPRPRPTWSPSSSASPAGWARPTPRVCCRATRPRRACPPPGRVRRPRRDRPRRDRDRDHPGHRDGPRGRPAQPALEQRPVEPRRAPAGRPAGDGARPARAQQPHRAGRCRRAGRRVAVVGTLFLGPRRGSRTARRAARSPRYRSPPPRPSRPRRRPWPSPRSPPRPVAPGPRPRGPGERSSRRRRPPVGDRHDAAPDRERGADRAHDERAALDRADRADDDHVGND